MLSLQVGLISAALLGWADIAVFPSKGGSSQAGWQRSIGALSRPTERTVETLKRYDLESRYRSDPEEAINGLERAARRSPEPDLVFALAELSWIEGRRLDGRRLFGHRRGGTALDRYVDTVAYAHDFLFDAELANGRQPTDPRYRLACDLYNGGLDRLIRAAQTKGRIQPGDTIRLKIHGDEQTLRVDLANTSWDSKDVDELVLSSDYEVTGLDSRSRQYGLGVPLIAVRRTEHSGRGEDEFFPPEMAFPLTAFVRPNSRLRDSDTDSRDCTLVLHDPVRTHAIGTGRDAVPLEADFTTPLAFMWSKTDLEKYRWTGLLRPGTPPDRATLMLLRPYEKDKIPVVMVHGLWSTPLAWIPMLNELLRDDRIRDRYQFLLYLYPTGVQVPIASAGLRDSLYRAQRSFDPDRSNASFQHMVLLGHSMGGLLSHAMVISSGNRWWELNTDKQFDDIVGPPDVLAELKHYNFFDAVPFVSRVVFLATPHRGSDLSRGLVGRVSSNLISEPDYYTKLLGQLIKANPDAFDSRRFRRLATSIEMLEPATSKTPSILSGILAMKRSETVKVHSIIGALRPGGVQETSDGVVPYWSSHLEGAASERVVRSDHGVQKDPEAILEVKRILLEHTGQTGGVYRTSLGGSPARPN
jgi:pimeloyl-ACP methyl ester carboxylesterase